MDLKQNYSVFMKKVGFRPLLSDGLVRFF